MIRQSVLGILLLCVATAMSLPTQSNNELTVLNGVHKFSTNIYKTLVETENKNLITSPYGVWLILAMASCGAGGTTAEIMKEVLHIPKNASLINFYYYKLASSVYDADNELVEIRMANKIYTNKELSVKPEFNSTMQDDFLSPSEPLDFSRPNDAATTINNWVKEQTNNKIQELVGASDLQGLQLALINAIYFKGNWQTRFRAKETKNRSFHVNANTVKQVPTMFVNDYYIFGSLANVKATFLVLPYLGEEFSMVIILPDEKTSLSEVEKNLEKIDIFNAITTTKKRDVLIYLPKFKIESKLKLKEPLKQLGLGEIFSNNANFSGISDTILKVNDLVQRAFIEVNEEGTVAFAATGGLTAEGISMPEVIKVDRPFIFAIIKKDPNFVLFQGRVVDPTVSY